MSKPCRWCGHQKPQTEDFVIDVGQVCEKCEACQDSFTITGGNQAYTVALWFNPDHSLFVEFSQKSGKTSRYILSEDKLRESGSLITSDHPMEGVRFPRKAR